MKSYKTIRFLLLFAFSTLSIIAFSQEKNVHFGASFNAKITHQVFGKESPDDSNDAFSYTFSGNIYYDLSPTILLISGLSFSHYQINQLDYSPIFACDYLGLDIDPTKSYFKAYYKTNYLGIPLEARYNFGGKTNHFFVQFGFESLFKVALNKSLWMAECGKSEREISLPFDFKEVNDFLLLAKIGVGYEFLIGKRMKLFFEPNIEYSLTKFFKGDSGNSNLLNFGLNTGVRF